MRNLLSVNRLAWKLLEKLLQDPEFYAVKVDKTSTGTTLVDAGIKAKGGSEAGRIITEICMGGLGKASIAPMRFGDLELQTIMVHTDHPSIATLGSQYAGWQISEEDCFAIGSGPARALALKPKGICEEINYKDECERAIVVLETEKYPPVKVLERIAGDCRISPDSMAAVLTPTTSLAGATQISGRIVETGIHKLRRLGFDPKRILHAWGCAPISPVHPKFAKAMARTNDAILYGGTASYVVKAKAEAELKDMVKKAPSSASRDYGRPFIEILKEAGYDFYKIDPDLFAPAVVIVNNICTGNTFTSGKINVDALKASHNLR